MTKSSSKKPRNTELPEPEALEQELKRVRYRSRYGRVLKSTVYTLVVVAAFAVLVAVLFLPVLRIYGSSMTPTLNEGEIVVSVKNNGVKQGDVVGVYFGSKLLVKRVIATEHQWVDIDKDGNVYVDGNLLNEPYVREKAFGECDIDLPYQVPDESIFVMGDHRLTSVDSRSSSVGAVLMEDVAGKIIFRVWPLSEIGKVNILE